MSETCYDDQDGLSCSSPTSIEIGDISEEKAPRDQVSSKRHRGTMSFIEQAGFRQYQFDETNDKSSHSNNPYIDERILDKNIVSVFLQKTFVMINECDPTICCWSQDGEKFIVKDPEVLAREVIPKYFGHNKFSSFSRQLNFYGFKKVQIKPIRNIDMDPETAKHIIFMNDNFKRDREDLLVRIHRSTRGTMTHTTTKNEQESEIQQLRRKVELLEDQIKTMSDEFKRKFLNLETSFASMLQISSGQLQQRTHLAPQPIFNESSNQQYPSIVEHSSVGATSDARSVSYFGDLGTFEDLEFQDFFI